MKRRPHSKHLKATTVPSGNVSKTVSNTNIGKRVSRTKKAVPELLEMLQQANTAPTPQQMSRIVLEDEAGNKREGELMARIDLATTKAEMWRAISQLGIHQIQQRTKLATYYDAITLRGLLLKIIEVAKRGEINYLRQCAECGHIFFAGRKDQEGCKPACLNRIRKQRWKKAYAEAKAGEKRGYLK